MAWGPGRRLLTASAVLCLARCWLGPLFSSPFAGDAFIAQNQRRWNFAGHRLDEVFRLLSSTRSRTDARRRVALQARTSVDFDSYSKQVLLDALGSLGYQCQGAFKKRDLVVLLEGVHVPHGKITRELNRAVQRAASKNEKKQAKNGEKAQKQTNGKTQTNGKKQTTGKSEKKKTAPKKDKGIGNGVSNKAMREFLHEIGHPSAFSISRSEALGIFEDMGLNGAALESMLGDGHVGGGSHKEPPPRPKSSKKKKTKGRGQRRRSFDEEDFIDSCCEAQWGYHDTDGFEYVEREDYFDMDIDDFLDPDFAKFHMGSEDFQYETYSGRQQRKAARNGGTQRQKTQTRSSTTRQATSANVGNPEQAMARALRERWQGEKLSVSQAQQLLGVTNTRDASQVRTARKQLVLKWHPDRNPDNPDASKALALVMAACSKLS